MQVVVHDEIVVEEVTFFRVVKKEIAVFTEVARVLLRPLIVEGDLFSPVYVARIAFLDSGP